MTVKIKVFKGNVEGAVRAFSNKIRKDKVLEEYKERQEFIKPSLKKRIKAKKARAKLLSIKKNEH